MNWHLPQNTPKPSTLSCLCKTELCSHTCPTPCVHYTYSRTHCIWWQKTRATQHYREPVIIREARCTSSKQMMLVTAPPNTGRRFFAECWFISRKIQPREKADGWKIPKSAEQPPGRADRRALPCALNPRVLLQPLRAGAMPTSSPNSEPSAR